MKIIAIRRDDRFSPNSVEKDRLILEAACRQVGARFGQQGVPCGLRWIDEVDLTADDEADLYLSMARLPGTLDLLEGFEQHGCRVINSARGIRNCQRSRLEQLMRESHIPMPPPCSAPYTAGGSFWLKRGDSAAQSRDDVVFCPDATALRNAIEKFRLRGIGDYVVSRHIEGDVVKFYGVGDAFFRHYYPTDDGQTKFDDETQHNGKARHYAFDVTLLQAEASRLARLLQVKVYGGDAIIDAEGRFFIIDFNDWPSFSRCREEAAEAIANLIE